MDAIAPKDYFAARFLDQFSDHFKKIVVRISPFDPENRLQVESFHLMLLVTC